MRTRFDNPDPILLLYSRRDCFISAIAFFDLIHHLARLWRERAFGFEFQVLLEHLQRFRRIACAQEQIACQQINLRIIRFELQRLADFGAGFSGAVF
ncbi:MAG: hypothetical protein ACRD9Y_10380 [Blastocatellia bacterium]